MITISDQRDILQNWLTQMSDQKNDFLETLKKDMDSSDDNDTLEDMGGDVEYLDVESVEHVHVDQEYYQEELYNGKSSGNSFYFLFKLIIQNDLFHLNHLQSYSLNKAFERIRIFFQTQVSFISKTETRSKAGLAPTISRESEC